VNLSPQLFNATVVITGWNYISSTSGRMLCEGYTVLLHLCSCRLSVQFLQRTFDGFVIRLSLGSAIEIATLMLQKLIVTACFKFFFFLPLIKFSAS
jgi:hypothetical protein